MSMGSATGETCKIHNISVKEVGGMEHSEEKMKVGMHL